MINNVFIYGLIDPRNLECFYIGQTRIGLKERLAQHIRGKNENRYKDNKINKIISLGLKPMIVELERCTVENYKEREIYWINTARNIFDWNLTNVSKGGDDVVVQKEMLIPIKQYTLTGEYIQTFDSCATAARSIMNENQDYNIVYSVINNCVNNKQKTAYNYQWCKIGDEDKIVDNISRKDYEHTFQFSNKLFIKNIKKRLLKTNNSVSKARLIVNTHTVTYLYDKKIEHNKKCREYNKLNKDKVSEAKRLYYQTEVGKQKKREEKKRYYERLKQIRLQSINNQVSG